MARAEHYEAPCPYLFGWDGDGYKFVDSAITSAFLQRYEVTTFDSASYLQPKDGYYDINLYGPFEDVWYINNLGLQVVDHPEGTQAIADVTGQIHTIADPQPVSAVDSYGNDVTALLAAQDLNYWASDLGVKDFESDADLHDWVSVTLPGAPAEGSAKLVMDVRSTGLSDFKLWTLFHYHLGTPNLGYLTQRFESDEGLIPYFDYSLWLTAALRIQYWNGSDWVDFPGIAAAPDLSGFFGRPQVVPVDLGMVKGGQIRLLMPAGMHEIDYIAVDYTADGAVTVTDLPLVAAEVVYNTDLDVTVTEDVMEAVAAPDGAYAEFYQGDYINYRFAAIDGPAEGMARTFVLPVGGYYHLLGKAFAEDRMDNLPMLEQLVTVPNEYARWSLPRYVDMDAYPVSQHFGIEALLPPFAADWDALNCDFVEIVITAPCG